MYREVKISEVSQKIDSQLFYLSELAQINDETIWSDGTVGLSPQNKDAKPSQNFYPFFRLEMCPHTSPPFAKCSFDFGFDGLSNKEDVKLALIMLASKF